MVDHRLNQVLQTADEAQRGYIGQPRVKLWQVHSLPERSRRKGEAMLLITWPRNGRAMLHAARVNHRNTPQGHTKASQSAATAKLGKAVLGIGTTKQPKSKA